MQCYGGARAKCAFSEPRERCEGQALDKQHCRGWSGSLDETGIPVSEIGRCLDFAVTDDRSYFRLPRYECVCIREGLLRGFCLPWSLKPVFWCIASPEEKSGESQPRATTRLGATTQLVWSKPEHANLVRTSHPKPRGQVTSGMFTDDQAMP
jgi:hypothetical protein